MADNMLLIRFIASVGTTRASSGSCIEQSRSVSL